jgi:predicted amidophosphoribosyltransferase
MDLKATLQTRFGFAAFREGQEAAIRAALEGKRVLLIQPTGWGKSLVYQMIAAMRGLTLVFSPLRALMRDQVRQATERFNLRADTVNSDMDDETQRAVLERAAQGELDLLYIAPERLQNPLWQEFQTRLPIRAVVIDEAHCISIWGHDFRPEYRRIVNLVRLLPREVPVVAVTATATRRVEQDVREQIGEPFHVLRGDLMRPNLRLRVIRTASEAEKLAWLATGLPQHTTRAILYDLQDQGLITRDTQRYYRAVSRDAPSFEQYDALLQAKLAELQAIVDYWETPDCRMRYLCRFLGDEEATACGQCDTCTGETLAPPPPALRSAAEAFAFHPPLNLDTKHQKELVYAAGVALSFYGNTPVGEAIHACKYGAARQPFPDWLVEQCASLIQQRFAGDGLEGIVPVPSTVSGSLVDDFAGRLAARLGVPLVPALRKVRPTQPQKDFTNAAQKAENIKGAFECVAPVQGKTLLVVDDVYDSGATLKEAGRILKQAGAGRLYAFCIARTRHRGDL